MTTTQLKTDTTTSGSTQTRMEDLIKAMNAFLGISGNEWNNT